MDLMHGPVAPPAIAWLPQTPGWSVVGVWLLVIFLIVLGKVLVHRKRNAYRRAALQALQQIAQAQNDSRACATAIAGLLKRTALAVYPREQVAPLFGDAWAQFLCETTSGATQIKKAAAQLASAAYDESVDGYALIEPAVYWIKHHRA